MLTRRELIAFGVAGGLSPVDAAELEGGETVEQQADRDGQKEIATAISRIGVALDRALPSNSLEVGTIGKLTDLMELHFKSTGRFPDYIDIGVSIFMELYNWHVRNRQQLFIQRGADNRYTIQFMLTTMILRQEVDRGHIGIPYEKA